MIRNTLLSLAALVAFSAAAPAQFCTDNQYRVFLTDADGVPAPTAFDPVSGETYYQFATESVYLAFDPLLPSGTYYVHVTDPIGGADMVLSTNDPMDRFVTVANQNGVISLSLPFSSNTPTLGLGLNGVGQSLLLAPFTTNPGEPCRFKAWYGDNWDLSNGPTNPYLLAGGIHPTTNLCAVRSYQGFRIGDGHGTAVSGDVFFDQDRDGVRDPGESGAANQQVRLFTATTSIATTTDGNGHYVFTGVTADSYTVLLVVPNNYVATTASSFAIEVCGCADVRAGDFGLATAMTTCNGHTIGYWRNRHGLARIQQYGILPTLPALGIVNSCGHRVAPGSLMQFKCWLQGANSVNMAYMLSAQLVAMHCNVTVGFVDPHCMIDDPCLGQITIADLMQRAVLSLWAHPFTGWCSPFRHQQERLKNALDRANNNQNWL